MGFDGKLTIEFGESAKEFLSDLATLIQQAEKVGKNLVAVESKLPVAKKATTAAQVDADNQADEAQELKKPAKKVVAKKVQTTEEQFDLGDSAEESEADETPSYTFKEVVAACKENKTLAKKLLVEKYKLSSIHDLKPGQYPRFMEELGA